MAAVRWQSSGSVIGEKVTMCVRRSRPLMNPRLQHVITELYIIYDSSGEIAPPPGFYKLPYDLNKGTSGNFVYLCYR